MNPKILSLGFAVPQYSVTQEEALKYFGFKSSFTRKIFEATGIERRYSYVNPERFASLPSWQEMCEEYAKGVIEMGVKAARDALDNYDVKDIGSITFVSVTGYTCPSPSYAIAGELGLPLDITHSNLIGQGCEAAVPGLERAFDYVNRAKKLALTISVELCSTTWFPVTTERDLEYITSASIFADGATAAIIGSSNNPKLPEIIAFESFFSPEYINLLGYKWVDGRLKVVLSRDVPKIVPPLIKKTIDVLLEKNNLIPEKISHWILHPGGKKVLENLEKELNLTRKQTYWSWEIMRCYGNMSSSTIGAVAKYVQQYEHPSGWGIVATMGAGTAVNVLLVRWD